ncbi:hypothetical protein M422DRAFT_256554 [Sphaerobolus stellatus SS14]|uniref:Uncharacterized protein n=1 Tax=Sphaerobolus stellatus (strain SS14) TaxID=990650 RepID=A0A0C9UBT3_SPHS4|nr:hypothetical protein M422DRAFT_256554 [Sphaerobolus stellatus SS14]
MSYVEELDHICSALMFRCRASSFDPIPLQDPIRPACWSFGRPSRRFGCMNLCHRTPIRASQSGHSSRTIHRLRTTTSAAYPSTSQVGTVSDRRIDESTHDIRSASDYPILHYLAQHCGLPNLEKKSMKDNVPYRFNLRDMYHRIILSDLLFHFPKACQDVAHAHAAMFDLARIRVEASNDKHKGELCCYGRSRYKPLHPLPRERSPSPRLSPPFLVNTGLTWSITRSCHAISHSVPFSAHRMDGWMDGWRSSARTTRRLLGNETSPLDITLEHGSYPLFFSFVLLPFAINPYPSSSMSFDLLCFLTHARRDANLSSIQNRRLRLYIKPLTQSSDVELTTLSVHIFSSIRRRTPPSTHYTLLSYCNDGPPSTPILITS